MIKIKPDREFFNTFPETYSDTARAPYKTADDIYTKIGASGFTPPTLFILSETKERLDLYIQCAKGEVSGLGEVSQIGRNFLVTAVHLLKQESTDGDTKIEKSAIHDYLYHAMRNEINPNSLKLWWHSHGDGNVFWSGTDDGTIAEFKNWIISIVGNKSGEYLTRLDIFTPIHLTVKNLDFRIRFLENKPLRKEIEREVAEKVKQRKITPLPYHLYYPLLKPGLWTSILDKPKKFLYDPEKPDKDAETRAGAAPRRIAPVFAGNGKRSAQKRKKK